MATRFKTKAEIAAEAQWTAFLAFCNRNARDNRWFRGVTNREHPLMPKIGRSHEGVEWHETREEADGSKINLGQRERRLFDAFRRRARLGFEVVPTTDFEWLALAQHHGVPTRLLDWTTNPLMAAWFATNPSRAPDNHVARVYSIPVSSSVLVKEDVDVFARPARAGIKFMVAPHWHPRVRAQRGCFSIHPAPNMPFDPKGMDVFDIEQDHWGEFRRRLYYFGVDASTVMADLAGLGDALAWQYENRVGIGQVGY